jgi:CRP/FNR family cyclic AMP-dependent transcriptional regulator
MTLNRHQDVFRSAYLFADLLPEEMALFLDRARYQTLGKDAEILREGDAGNMLYLVLNGSVRVTKRVGEGVEQVIGFLRPGEFFGEMALLDSLPRSASVYANSEVEFAILEHADLTDIFSRNAPMGLKVVRKFAEVLSVRLRETNDRLRVLLQLERTL